MTFKHVLLYYQDISLSVSDEETVSQSCLRKHSTLDISVFALTVDTVFNQGNDT